jgi:hypothetical protein
LWWPCAYRRLQDYLVVSLSMLDCHMKTTVSRILRGLPLSFPSCFFRDENPIFSFDWLLVRINRRPSCLS